MQVALRVPGTNSEAAGISANRREDVFAIFRGPVPERIGIES
jgi:hypothetical protein